MQSTETTSPILKTGMQAMEMARGVTVQLVEPFDAVQMLVRPCAEGNHVAWNLGHIADTDNVFLTMVGGRDAVLDESWSKKFGWKSVVSENAGDYPSKQELLDAMSKTREAVVGWLTGLSDAELNEPIEGDMAQFAKSRAHLMSSIAFHEGFHAGQISACRRAVGIERLF